MTLTSSAVTLTPTHRDVLDLDLDVALGSGGHQDLGGAVSGGVDFRTEARAAANAGSDSLPETRRQVFRC